MADPRYKNASFVDRSITERSRSVRFSGESPTEDFIGSVEVMTDSDGNMSLHVQRSHKKKLGEKWTTASAYVTLSPEAWAHLISAPIKVPANGEAS